MTTYKELFGKYVQNVTSDPTSTDAEGQIWYNTTSGTFKTALGGFGVWSSGGNMNTARGSLAGAGIQTAAIGFGGEVPPANNPTNASESYNGTSWTTLPATLATSRDNLRGSQSGTATATVVFGGNTPSVSSATEEYSDPTFATKTITTS